MNCCFILLLIKLLSAWKKKNIIIIIIIGWNLQRSTKKKLAQGINDVNQKCCFVAL